MKNFSVMIILTFGILCFSMTSCSEQKQTVEKAPQKSGNIENLATTPEDIKKEAKDLARTTMTYTEEQKALYQEKIQNKMQQYSQKFAELEAKLALMHEQAKADMATEIENLRRKKTMVAKKVEELRDASDEAYDDLKNGMDRAIEEMDKAYDQAIKRFGEK